MVQGSAEVGCAPHLHGQRVWAMRSPWVGGKGAHVGQGWPFPVPAPRSAIFSPHSELGCGGVDEKEEKLLDEKKFEKKVSEIFKLESDIIETAAHGSVHSNLFKLGA